MSQSLRHIKSRIRGIESTKKLTKAMEMVSVAKMKKTEKLLGNSNLYFLKIEEFLKKILSSDTQIENPYIREPKGPASKAALCVFASDTGLSGTYNQNILRAAENFLIKYDKNNIDLVAVGRKTFSYFKRKGYEVKHSFLGFNGRYSESLSEKILNTLTHMFLSGEVDEVYLVYTKIESASRYKIVLEKFLNISYPKDVKIEYIYEPDKTNILKNLLPMYISNKLKVVLLNAFNSEHQARAVSMGGATKNAIELLEAMILLRNKMRQTNITREIMEVISSAEALKG